MNCDLKKLGADPTDEEILSNCVIRDMPGDKPLNHFTPEQQDFIALARVRGLTCIGVLWLTRECILFMCEPCALYPDPALIIEKFREVRRATAGKGPNIAGGL